MKAIAICALLAGTGCTSISGGSRTASSIDAGYRYSRIRAGAFASGDRSPGVSFYQNVLSQTLGSHCTLFPSDSRAAQAITARCGAGISALRSMSRFYLEPDAPRLRLPVIAKGSEILFEDEQVSCGLL